MVNAGAHRDRVLVCLKDNPAESFINMIYVRLPTSSTDKSDKRWFLRRFRKFLTRFLKIELGTTYNVLRTNF